MISVVVTNKTAEAKDICSLEMRSTEGIELPAFEPGAHVDVYLPNGMVRQYSLCNALHEREFYRIAVLKDPASRGGSVLIHDRVNPGDRLSIDGPRNNFPLVPGSSRTVLLAGGIGVTPLVGMAERLHLEGRNFELHYCTRSPEQAAFRDWLTTGKIAKQTRFYFDNAPAEEHFSCEAVLGPPRTDTRIYVCGPTGFIDFVRKVAKETGWPEDSIRQEYFSAVADVARNADATEFEVILARSKKTVLVPAHKSIAEALQDADVNIPVSCEQGICGACVTSVLGGEPDHRDLVLTPKEHAEGRYITPCISRARSKSLILDL